MIVATVASYVVFERATDGPCEVCRCAATVEIFVLHRARLLSLRLCSVHDGEARGKLGRMVSEGYFSIDAPVELRGRMRVTGRRPASQGAA